MGNRRRVQRLAVGLSLAGLLSHSHAQDATPDISVSPTPTQTTSRTDGSSSTPSASESATTNIPLNLWGIADQLISSYYPSTSISDIASLTWPSVVVIQSSTYTVHSSATSPSTLATIASSSQPLSRPVSTDTTTASDAEPSEEPKSDKPPKDRTLGIALGVVFGVLTLAVMAFALLCVHRRQKKHGGTGIFPSRRRRATSPTDSEVGAWRSRHPHMGMVTTVAGPMTQVHNRPPREWVERYNRLDDQRTPPAHLHPAFMQQRSGNDDRTAAPAEETNPFFAPAPAATDRSSETTSWRHPQRFSSDYHPGYPNKPGFTTTVVPTSPYRPELETSASTRRSRSRSQSSHRRRSSSSAHSDPNLERRERSSSRPPTPFSPMMMLQTSLPPHYNNPNTNNTSTNPFASPEDEHQSEDYAQRQRLTQPAPGANDYEQEDVVSPMIAPPSKSPARRNSPLVHYPSWSEVSEFNFTGEEEAAEGRRVRGQRSRSGGDGYRRDRESVVGRTELA